MIAVDIPYPTRSQFLDACEAAIRDHRGELQAGEVVHVDLHEGGYHGRVIVTIHATDRTVFGTDWERPDPTRFPARIRAAAAALLKCRCEGQFEISHSDGCLTIRAV
jgi:hypothetical protein